MQYFGWWWKMAWRDSRRSRGKLFLFLSCIALGIAALVAINSFNQNLRKDINQQAKELIGADLVIAGNRPLPDSLQQLTSRMHTQQANECTFASMVYFPKNGGTRLVQVRALSGNFPFYGQLETIPPKAQILLQRGPAAIIDQTLALQFKVAPGDSLKVGQLTLPIVATLVRAPGQASIVGMVAAPVYIPFDLLEATGLLQKGSRLIYRYYFQFSSEVALAQALKEWQKPIEEAGFNLETVEMRKRSIGRAFDNLNSFLNLAAFIALLLGCVGVASAVQMYVAEKISLVALLRCLGATKAQAVGVYMLQIFLMGMIGSTMGTVVGAGLQLLLPFIFKDFLPIEITSEFVPSILASGVIAGSILSLLFSLPLLLQLRHVSPLKALRSAYENHRQPFDGLILIAYFFIGAFIVGFARWQLNSWQQTGNFIIGLAIAFALLAGIGQGLRWLLRRWAAYQLPYPWRQGIANLYRPGNQTIMLTLAIGLGTGLIVLLFLLQETLLKQIEFAHRQKQPNFALFDVQTSQLKEVTELMKKFDLPILQQVPIVTMRIAGINGRSVRQIKADSTSPIPSWALDREYRVTYRDSLTETERHAAGIWQGWAKPDSICISFDQSYAQRMGVKLGDRISFDVQGVILETTIGHLRKVDFLRIQTNFLVLFPRGVLENAPQFYVLLTRVPHQAISAKLQRALMEQFPTISAIDLGLVLKTVDEVIDRVAFAIRLMAMLSILTGWVTLASSVVISRYQRIRESVLLRTIGAVRRQIFAINAVEYLTIGIVAALAGVLLGLAATWALSYWVFDVVFVPNLLMPIATLAAIVILTVGIGLFNIGSVVSRPPLEVLRAES
ncbi:MAG: FtsX-like permease family protein [Cytophagales bacterium]|nr:FtsX-like permease family protein [Cytophagales bacterium]